MAETDVKTKWQLGRVNVLTSKAAAELAKSREFSARVKAHCFFSARVCEARILSRLRSEVDDYVTGKVNRDRAVANLQTFLRGEGYITGEGLGPPPGVSREAWKRSRRLANLAATARLRLILDVNLREANAVRRYAAVRGSGAPYLRYVASYKRNKRPDHLKLVGMVLPADHPFWRNFPRDYRCGCSYEAVWSEKEAAESGGVGAAAQRPDGGWEFERGGQKIVSPPNPSGFEFDAAEAFAGCDMSRIRDGGDRRACLASLGELARRERIQIHCMPGGPTAGPAAELPDFAATAAKVGRLAGNKAAGRPIANERIPLGALSGGLTESIGLTGEATLAMETTAGKSGLSHNWAEHRADYLDGTWERAVREALTTPGVTATLTLMPNGCDIINVAAQTGAMVTLVNHGQIKTLWLLSSAQYPAPGYVAQVQRQK